MQRLLILGLVFGLVAGLALAQNGNPCPGDKEYQFNIIGMDKGKTPPMDGNNGHRIFVWLKGKSTIYMTGDTDPNTDGLQCGKSFNVLDANATDADGAKLLVPCDPLTADHLNPSVCYDVWATPLGTPGGSTKINVVCEFTSCVGCNIDGGDCGLDTVDYELAGHNGRPKQYDISGLFRASGCIDLGGEVGVCDTGDINFNNEWIFNIEQLLYYYWDYDNDGNRVVQIRFCDVEGQFREDGSPTCGPNNIVL